MKIYFAGSIRGGREKVEDYKKIIKVLSGYGTILTEHVADENLLNDGEKHMTDKEIYERDVAWLDESDVIIAEVTVTSLGVGYEIGYAEAKGKKILCLFHMVEGGATRTSAMVSGNRNLTMITYTTFEELEIQLSKQMGTF